MSIAAGHKGRLGDGPFAVRRFSSGRYVVCSPVGSQSDPLHTNNNNSYVICQAERLLGNLKHTNHNLTTDRFQDQKVYIPSGLGSQLTLKACLLYTSDAADEED